MLIKLGSFTVQGVLTSKDETRIEAKLQFTGYSYEISVQEMCEWVRTEFGILVQFIKGALKLSREIRKDCTNWVETYNECANLAQEGEKFRAKEKAE